MVRAVELHPRQLWNFGARPSTTTEYCTAVTLPAQGILSLASDNVLTLTKDIIFRPLCTTTTHTDSNTTSINPLGIDSPFYASALPLVYAIAAATVLAWLLVVVLIISPRTFYTSSAATAVSFASGLNVFRGTSALANIGSRPWLQKAAALTVAISLTIATADTFKVAKTHYLTGGLDGDAMRDLVEQSLEIRIIRLISRIFVWLAQVQTLIRLFPRHREKILIKWIALVLLIADTIFSCLNSFLVGPHRPSHHHDDAISALSYLFQLAVGLLYAAWVLYYSIVKRRYAFWHPKMKNISLVAFLALLSILTPVVFFVTDVTISDVARWGDFFQWVGAAAASVVVWEWVERIEALEREEKKDGLLGREVFADGDDVLDASPTTEMIYVRRRNDQYVAKGFLKETHGTPGGGGLNKFVSRLARSTPAVQEDCGTTSGSSSDGAKPIQTHTTARLQPPEPSISPVDRADNNSAASTVYVVCNSDSINAPQPVRRRACNDTPDLTKPEAEPEQDGTRQVSHPPWKIVANPFKRKRTTPPAQIRAAMETNDDDHPRPSETSPAGRWRPPLPRIDMFAAKNLRRQRREQNRLDEVDELPWIVIPAQPRGAAAWSPHGQRTTTAD